MSGPKLPSERPAAAIVAAAAMLAAAAMAAAALMAPVRALAARAQLLLPPLPLLAAQMATLGLTSSPKGAQGSRVEPVGR